MTSPPVTQTIGQSHAATVGWGFAVGVVNALAPVAIWWLDASTVHAFAITLIAAIYIGFAVADGRSHVIAVEVAVAASFVVVAMAAVSLSPWLIVAGYVGHGGKDLWQHRTHFVADTRWWPPFCAVVDRRSPNFNSSASPGSAPLEGSEGAFLPCSFWLVQALALTGRRDEAEARFGELLRLGGPFGLYGEEMDPVTGDHLGNYPQTLTHAALVQAALALGEQRDPRELPGEPERPNARRRG
jgi:hypothetical protein